MIKIQIEEILFRPKFPCSLSILAKIQDQQFLILEQMPFNQKIPQQGIQFPIQSSIQLQNLLNSSKEHIKFQLNVGLKTSSGKVKLASIKQLISEISHEREVKKQKLLNCHDKNAYLIYSIVFDSLNFGNNNKIQLKNELNKNNQKLAFHRHLTQEKQNQQIFQIKRNIKNKRNQGLAWNTIRPKISLTNLYRQRLSPQLTSMRSLQSKRQESTQSKKTSRLSRVHNEDYKHLYLQIKDKMKTIQRKFLNSQQNTHQLEETIKRLQNKKYNLQQTNKRLQRQLNQKDQILAAQKKEYKKIKNILTQSERQNIRKIQNHINQNQKLEYRQALIKEKLKLATENIYKFQNEIQKLQNQVVKLKDQINKKNNTLSRIQKQLQQQQKGLKKQLKEIKSKSNEFEAQNKKLRKSIKQLELEISKLQQQKTNEKQLLQQNKKLSESSQKLQQTIQNYIKKNQQIQKELKSSKKLIQDLQRRNIQLNQQKLKEGQLKALTQSHVLKLQEEFQRISREYNQVSQEKIKLKQIQKDLKNSIAKVAQNQKKEKQNLGAQLKIRIHALQKSLHEKNNLIQEKNNLMEEKNDLIEKKQLKILQLNKQIEKGQLDNEKFKDQVQALKQKIDSFQLKSKKSILKQSVKSEEFQAQKMIKFNLAQLSEYEKIQQQNEQLKKQIKKMQKSITQLKQTATLQGSQKIKVSSQTEIRTLNLKQSLSSTQTKQKLMKLAEMTNLNQKAKQFQNQKLQIVKKYQEQQKQILQKNKQLDQKCRKMSRIISQSKENLQDRQLIISSFKTNFMKGLKHIQDVSKLITQIQKNQKISPNTLLSLRQNIKKLQAIISKVPKGVQVQCEENQLPMIKLSKPKSKKQSPQKERQIEMNKSQVLYPGNPQKQNAMNRSQILLNISKSIFMNDSIRSCNQSGNSDQNNRSHVGNILQD